MAIIGIHNIGKVLELKLSEIGIDSFDKLKEAGTEKIFLKLLEKNKNTSKSVLYAIEGAIVGIRWHKLGEARKEELKKFHDSIFSNSIK
jgi:DNA transformation protein